MTERRERAISMRGRPSLGSALGAALLKVLAGSFVVVAVLAAIIVPLGIGAAFWGPNWGATVGCTGSAIVQLGLVSLIRRFPDLPGAPIADAICSKCIALMTVFSPIGAAIELINDRATATWTGVAIGVGILGLGLLTVRWSRRRSTRHRPHHPAATVIGTTAGITPSDHGPGIDIGGDGGA